MDQKDWRDIMLDQNFDPYQAMINMDQNIQQLIKAHNALAHEVERQSEVIDVLIKGLNAANKANQELMSNSLDRFLNNISSSGQH